MGTLTFTVRNRWNLDPPDWEEVCNDLFEFLQDITPVDTGNCRDSWEIAALDGDECTYFNDAEYASFLDDGWSSQAPAGMTGPASAELESLVANY